jgi:hypothetical protein
MLLHSRWLFSRWLFPLALAGSAIAQDPGISMRIGTENGGMHFRMGERISLTLTFETETPEGFETIITRDRMVPGPNEDDSFLVSPAEGATDPMGYRVGQGGAFSILGGKFPYATTSVAHVDLNQWVRFERPGFYRVHALFHVRSHPNGQNIALESNDIGIEIVAADAEWQTGQLRETVDILQTTKQDNQTFETIMNAARRIGYLDTPDSIRESGRLLGSAQVQVCQILKSGLLASAHRTDAAVTMAQLFRNPDQPVSREFLETLAALETREVQELRSELAEAVGQKQGSAKTISMKALAEIPGEH